MENIIIRDAYENNLKHLNVEIPLDTFTCVTGCSGCGKSSLVFDTIYAESQRGFLEGMSGNLFGQKIMNKPKVGLIKNLRPALNISQNYYNVNPRSTIGTITEISYYLRSLFSVVNSSNNFNVSENYFSSNNPKSFCPNCFGLGKETIVSEDLLIPDKNKKLSDGAILLFKGIADGKESNFLQALCDYYGIDINKKISELTKEEYDILVYSTNKIKYKITYKEGKRRKQHYVFLQGAISLIKEKLANIDITNSNIYSKYMEDIPCHICHGSKLRQEILDYKICGLNYFEIEGMEITQLKIWFENFNLNNILETKRDIVGECLNSILTRLVTLIKLNVGYLSLNRSVPSLSGGERQRIRIATQLNCPLKGLIYILDEPCKGLHYRDIAGIIKATNDLIDNGNTVIAIEHNKQYINSANHVLELGPVGGPKGGYIVSQTKTQYIQSEFLLKNRIEINDFFELKDINFRNIKNQNVKIPVGYITFVTGVSGSGKTTLANVIQKCIERKNAYFCKSILGADSIKKVIEVNQNPIGKTPRSTVVSYLEIFDEIRTIYSNTFLAKKMRLNASYFSMNVKGGRCEFCQGTGFQKIDLNYLPSSYILCPECKGKRYNAQILTVDYKGKNIQEVLDSPIIDILELFDSNKKITAVLNNMIMLGLGYLTLGQMSMNLSGGEAQRIKLAKALGNLSSGHNLYILDEPTSGLNEKDIAKFNKILLKLRENRETIIIIEHNIDFIYTLADYIVDFGVFGGETGGKIVAQGHPNDVFNNHESSLYGIKFFREA